MGLVKYGKGDWRNISRNFVITKTPTQVASHAQKYYIRQKLSGGNNNNNNNNNNSSSSNKRRPSIHDITIVNLTESSNPEENKPPVFNESPLFSPHPSQKPNIDGVMSMMNPSCDTSFLLSSSSSSDYVLLHDAYSYANLKTQGFRANSGDHFDKAAILGIHAL